ncbi:hypothetical protein MKX08_006030 [Trichoderma sp. CBMAI-0020]|nr:hypothetical protein MKX08_006030 [Trichoderma sp. CBMAI-0020]
MGTSNMLEATPNDASLRCFEVDADNTFGTPTQSNHRSSPHVYPDLLATAQDSFPISNGQSPQLSSGLSFTTGLGRAGSTPDWLPPQPSAANNDSLIFSSSGQYNPGLNHYPHSAAQTQMTVYDTPQQPHERGDGECQRGPYSEDQFPTQLFENRFSNIPVTQSYNYLGQPHAYTFSQPDSGTRSGHSSNGSTPIATCPGVKDMVPGMYNSANDAPEDLYSVGSSRFHLPSDMQLSQNLETSNSYHSPETDFTLSPFEPTSIQHQVPSRRASRGRRFTTSHHGTLETNIQRLSLRRSSSTKPSNRHSPIAQAHLQPKPRKIIAEGTERSPFSLQDTPLPRKGRGRRTKPLEEGKRKAATRRRNERTVCIGCKLAKVMCEGREHGRDCNRCASGHINAPKPFVCVPASFIELIQQGSTMLLDLHTIHFRSLDGFRQAISIPVDINVQQLLGSIHALKRSHGVIRAYERGNVVFELDLQACHAFISANYPPTSHTFRQFIDGLKFQRQGHWKACIKNSAHLLETLCDTLFMWDDAALQVTYSGAYEVSNGTEGRLDLNPNNEQHKQVVFAAAQLYRIIGRQLELQFYDHLKRALGRPNICHEVVLEVGRALISLRRRLTLGTPRWDKSQAWDNVPFPPEIESYTDEDNDNDDSLEVGSIIADRVKNLCLILYVYFCYMRRRLPVEDQGDLYTMEVWDPETDQMMKEDLPQYESTKGFEDWLRFNDN